MRTLSFVAGFLALGAALAAAQDAYEVRLERPYRQGEAFLIDGFAVRHQSQKVLANGQEVQSDVLYVKLVLAGRVEILAVSDKGRPERASLLVERCLLSEAEGQEPREVVARGKKLLVELTEGVPVISLEGGGDLPESLTDVGTDLLPVEPAKSADNDKDAMFATREKHKVGETWPMDPAAGARSLGESMGGVPLDPAGLKGSTTIRGLATIDGEPCLQVFSEVKATGLPAPPGFTTERSEIGFELEADFPVDLTQGMRRKKARMTFEADMTGKAEDGQPVRLETRMSQEQECTFTPVP